MPQMKPMNWIMIFLISLLCYWSMFSNIFFSKNKMVFLQNIKKTLKTKTNLKW